MSADGFPDRFAEWWRRPDPDTVGVLLAADVVLRQPLTPMTRGLPAAQQAFRSLFELIPDLAATVHRSATTGTGVLIEFTLHGTLGGRPLAWDAVDRIELGDDGLAVERVSYFDPLPLVAALALRPRAWPAALRAARRTAMRGKIPA